MRIILPILLFINILAAAPFAYVTNHNSDNVSVIDTTTNSVVATIGVGDDPIGVAALPDGSRVYVANAGSDNVSVIDTATNSVVATIGVGDDPQCIAIVTRSTRPAPSVNVPFSKNALLLLMLLIAGSGYLVARKRAV